MIMDHISSVVEGVAVPLHATDFRAVVVGCDVLCLDCFRQTGIDPEDPASPPVYPVFANSEWDYFPVCDACGEVHDYVKLTGDGTRYTLGG